MTETDFTRNGMFLCITHTQTHITQIRRTLSANASEKQFRIRVYRLVSPMAQCLFGAVL